MALHMHSESDVDRDSGLLTPAHLSVDAMSPARGTYIYTMPLLRSLTACCLLGLAVQVESATDIPSRDSNIAGDLHTAGR